MGGYAPINMKSAAVSTGALTADIIYRLNRETESFVAVDYANDGATSTDEHDHEHGMVFQNRTLGPMYLWYGVLPSALQVPTEFKKAAYLVAAGGTFQPPMSQTGLCYALFENPTGAYIHHFYH